MNILTIVAGGTGVIALIAAGTLLLPRHVHVERQATFKSTVEAVISLASSNEGYQRFNPYRTSDPQLKITHFGPTSGVGSGFQFDGKEGSGSLTVAEVSSTSVRYDIDLGTMGKPSQKISVHKTSNGVNVIWSMDADLGMNPMARVFGLFMDGMIGKKLQQGLTNLATAT